MNTHKAVNEAIPEKTLKLAAAWIKKQAGEFNWWNTASLPAYGIRVTTDGCPRSHFKPGVTAWIVGGSERIAYLGESMTETTLPEFTLLTESGGQSLCQYGRDFVFANA